MLKKIILFLSILFLSTYTLIFAESIKIMSLGDSITAGHTYQNYRKPLQRMLKDSGNDVNFVGLYMDNFNEAYLDKPSFYSAIWGIRADTINLYYIKSWMENANPDVILLHIGTNDLWQGRTVGATVDSLSSMIDKIRDENPTVVIFLAQIIKMNNPLVNENILQYNNEIETLIENKSTFQSPIYLVDQNDGFDLSIMSYDGVHPNIIGDEFMAKNWYEALIQTNVCEAPNEPISTNISLGKSTTTNSEYIYAKASNATNGNQNDAWIGFSYEDNAQYIEVDLGNTYKIKRFELMHYSISDTTNWFNTREYYIEISDDHENWSRVITQSNLDSGTSLHDALDFTARYVKLVITNPNGYGLEAYNYVFIRKFSVFGYSL